MKLIEKNAVLAEINKLEIKNSKNSNDFNLGVATYLGMLKHFINSLEVKEVDLEKEFCDYLEKNFRIGMTGILLSNNGEPINTIKLFDFAKHFFEIGKQYRGE